MFDALSKAFFHTLAGSGTIKQAASRYGMRRPSSFARRFIAGETVQEAIDAARRIETAGMQVTLDYLGESVASIDEAAAATREYLTVVDAIAASGVGRNISLKLTQLGLDVDRATTVDNLRRILDRAAPHDFFVRIDMESSEYTERTLEIFETLWNQGYRNAGVVIQSYLRRSEQDVRRMNALGARVRLVKGAYKEPRAAAYQAKSEVDEKYLELMTLLLDEGTYPAIATHDPAIIDATLAHARARGYASNRFEIQMLYGIRRDLQAELTAAGYPFRVYVPFGREWFPYFMRRLGERPANVMFIARSLFR
ncbi:MAG: proline dehydrogenase family protein [Acidobacteriota bacterium]|nr:proline dehydrogenase family protein [Acidobacteriota bacterium]